MWPLAIVQTCIIHLIRNTFRLASKRDWDALKREVNRKLSALSAFYLHAARNGADLGELLITWGPAGRRGGWKPFLHLTSARASLLPGARSR